jgi:hypothetical protein
MSDLNGSGEPRSARRRARRTAALLSTVGLIGLAASLSVGAAAAGTADHSANVAVGASRGVVHDVHLHGRTIRVETHGHYGVVGRRGARAHAAAAAASGGLVHNGGPVEHTPTSRPRPRSAPSTSASPVPTRTCSS